jgi:UDP-glucose 4-epimerase
MGSSADSVPVIVTGGAGAIGTVLSEALARRGQEVRVLDNLSSALPTTSSHLAKVRGIQLHQIDVRDLTSTAPLFRGANGVWHLAANPDIRRGTEDPRLDLEHGVLATFNVLEAARRNDVPKVHFSSSSVVYGLPDRFPTPEDYGPLCPQSIYGGTKLAGEALLSAFCHSYGMEGHIFRFANVIGPQMTHGVIYDFFEKLRKDPSRLEVLGDGRQAKSYLRVEDCVEAMLLASDRAHDRVNIFNLGTPDQTSVKEIAELVVAAHRNSAQIVYTGGDRGWVGDIPVQLLAIERIRKVGWQPRYSSGEAVRRTIQEFGRLRGVLRP